MPATSTKSFFLPCISHQAVDAAISPPAASESAAQAVLPRSQSRPFETLAPVLTECCPMPSVWKLGTPCEIHGVSAFSLWNCWGNPPIFRRSHIKLVATRRGCSVERAALCVKAPRKRNGVLSDKDWNRGKDSRNRLEPQLQAITILWCHSRQR